MARTPSKRRYGVGSKTEVRPGVWRLRVSVKDPATGKSRQAVRTVDLGKKRGTDTLAEMELRKFSEELKSTGTVGSGMTVNKLCDLYLQRCEAHGLAMKTVQSYRQHMETHIKPRLGAVRLDQLNKFMFERYFNGLAEKGLAQRTIELDRRVLSAMQTYALDHGWMTKNYVMKMTVTASKKATMVGGLSEENLRALYFGAMQGTGKTSSRGNPDYAMAIALAAVTGCRRGELCGLRWEDVDWDQRCIRVSRQWVVAEGGQYLQDSTKTGKPREVFFGREGFAMLTQYRDDLLRRTGIEPDGWLLSFDAGTTNLNPRSFSSFFSQLAKRLGIQAHLHQLRHFAGTQLIRQGVDIATAAQMMGHSPGVLVSIYAHTSDAQGRDAGERVGGVVAAALEPVSSLRPRRHRVLGRVRRRAGAGAFVSPSVAANT